MTSVGRPEPLDDQGSAGHCRPALVIAVGELGQSVATEAATRLLTTEVPIDRIVRFFQVTVGTHPSDDGPPEDALRWDPDAEAEEQRAALTASLDNAVAQVLDARALQAVQDAGSITDTGGALEVAAVVVGDVCDSWTRAVFADVVAAAGGVARAADQRLLLIPVLAVCRAPDEDEAEIASHTSEVVQHLRDELGTMPSGVQAVCYIADCVREDSSRLRPEDLVQAIAQALFISLSPSGSRRPWLLSGERIAPPDDQPCMTGFGAASLVVPFGAIKQAVRARLAAELLGASLLASPEERRSSHRQAALDTPVLALVGEEALFGGIFEDVPVKAEYRDGQPSIEIDPSYSAPLHRRVRQVSPVQWASRIASFDSALGRIYVPTWLDEMQANARAQLQTTVERLHDSAAQLLRRPRECIAMARALVEVVRERIAAYLLPDIPTAHPDEDMAARQSELEDAINQYPNIYALSARVGLAAVVLGYLLWYLFLRLGVPEKAAVVVSVLPLLAGALVYVYLELGRCNTRLLEAREAYLRAVSAKYSTVLLQRLQSLVSHYQSAVRAQLDTVSQQLDSLEETAKDSVEHLECEAASLTVRESPIERSVVAEDDLPDIYERQDFQVSEIANELVEWPLLGENWPDYDSETLRSRILEFCEPHVARLNLMSFHDFVRRRYGDQFAERLEREMRELAEDSLVLAPPGLVSTRDAREMIMVLCPPDQAIANIAEQVSQDIGASDVFREDKYCITVLRIAQLGAVGET